MVKTTSFVPASRSFGAAAVHIACGGIGFLKSSCSLCCAESAVEQTNKSNGRVTFCMNTLYAENGRRVP